MKRGRSMTAWRRLIEGLFLDLDHAERSPGAHSAIDQQHGGTVMKMSRFGEAVSYFGEVLEVSPATVDNHWRMTRAWFTRQLAKEPHS